MVIQSESLRITLLVTTALESLGVVYAVGGSLSSSLHGVIRSTLDVDIVADLEVEQIQPLAAALAQEFYTDVEMMLDAVVHQSSFNLIHYATSFKVDIFIPKGRPYDREQLARRTQLVVDTKPQRALFVVSPEDVILAKLEWFRMGGEVSDRQWHDILGVLKTKSGKLDQAYLTRWAASLSVLDLLERALAAA